MNLEQANRYWESKLPDEVKASPIVPHEGCYVTALAWKDRPGSLLCQFGTVLPLSEQLLDWELRSALEHLKGEK